MYTQLYNEVQSLFRLVWEYPTQEKYRNSLYASRPNISPAMLDDAGIGIAPLVDHHVPDYLYAQGYTEEKLIEAGLVKFNTPNKLAMVHRYTLPIYNERGDIISFVGRSIDDGLIPQDRPKWKSSPNTNHFTRGHHFYNEYTFAKQIGYYSVTLIEGYFDQLCLVGYGDESALSMFGIQITDMQVQWLLRKGVREFNILLDGDLAGMIGTLNTILKVKSQCYDAKVSIIDAHGKDPDEMLESEYWQYYDCRRFVNDKQYHPLEIVNNTLKEIDLLNEKHMHIMSNSGWGLIMDFVGFFAHPFVADVKEQIFEQFGKKVSFKKNASLNSIYQRKW